MKAVIIFFLGSLLLTACKKDDDLSASKNPVASAIDPGTGKGGDVLTLTGSGLGDMVSILFDKDSVPAGFNPNFNTANAVIFRIPDTASGGKQHIVLTNRLGKQVQVDFDVLALPLVKAVSSYNFTTGKVITLTGIHLQEVSSVKLTGTSTEATIISRSKKQLVIAFPATDAASTTLDITNITGTVTTTQVFVNLNKAFHFFVDDYENGWTGNFWGSGSVSGDFAVSGTTSLKLGYAKGNWSANGVANWGDGLALTTDYKYLSFYIKGGSIEYTLYLTGDQREVGYGNADQNTPIVVPPNVWTYYKIPLADLGLWKKGTPFHNLGFWIKGPDTKDEVFYLDDLILVK